MTREIAVLITVGVALVLLALMGLAWRKRSRRDGGLSAPTDVPADAAVTARHEVLYVATTRHDQPLERLALRALTYRARGEAALTDQGLTLRLDGSPAVFLACDRLVDVGRSTWTIDRVVEPGGLVRIIWLTPEGETVDSYLRLTAGDPSDFIRSLAPLCQASPMGADA